MRRLGRTGQEVSAIGLGCGPLGDETLEDAAAIRLVHTALDLGVTLFDTAPSYGSSEARLGRALRGRRAVIVTKGGYGVPGVADWTPEVIARGIDRALGVLGVEALGVFLLHSCDRERLARGDLLAPLVHARAAGKVRAIGYSGDGDALSWAAGCADFDVLECSVNLFDQQALATAIPQAVARGAGVLAKRALGNAPWTARERPARTDAAVLWDRMRTMFPDGAHLSDELAIRFAAHAPGVSCALIGTRSEQHLRHAIDTAEGPLDAAVAADVALRFQRHGAAWPGVT